jgi:hypothetical protein
MGDALSHEARDLSDDAGLKRIERALRGACENGREVARGEAEREGRALGHEAARERQGARCDCRCGGVLVEESHCAEEPAARLWIGCCDENE